MSLFIESAQRAAHRCDVVARWDRGRAARGMDDSLDLDEAPGYEVGEPVEGPAGGVWDDAARRVAMRSVGALAGSERAASGDAAPASPVAPGAERSRAEAYSTAQEAYRDALSYDKQRTRARKRSAVLRVLAIVVLTPLALVLLFLAAYATTCIVNGASPEELVELMGQLFERVAVFAAQVLGRAA